MAAVLIIGASRGIGYELARQYRADQWLVIGTGRDEAGLARLSALGVKPLRLDATSPEAPAALQAGIAGQTLDVAIFCAGIYGPRTQQLEPPSEPDFDGVMRINVLAAMRLAPITAPALAREKGTLAVISSRMASVGTRSAPSGWLYRASKAALNSVLKDMSLVLGPQGITCLTFHPGWVKTDMGGAGADIDVTTSVTGIRKTIAAATPAQNGAFLNYDGATIPW
jgi:NAD(P)-dependent dehydrogenase (short-subunit alcohol dehydrogenase family)